MAISDALLPEFDHEMASTRRTLERVPVDKFGWKPHEKSGTLGWLATHVASLPGLTVPIMQKTELDVTGPDAAAFRARTPGSSEELLALFDKTMTTARAAIAATTDEEFMKPWTLRVGAKVFFTQPRAGVFRGMVMNHLIHHRGQLTVYLRLNNAPVPGLYGPSADEPM